MRKRAATKGHRGGLIVVLLLAASPPAYAQDDAAQRANRMAYEASMKCFVADGVARSDAMDRGQQALAASFDSKAREAFADAVKLGAVLGFDNAHINQDFGLAQSRELPKMMADSAYFRGAVGTCKALGLM
jgi:hypothetical protein